MDGSTQGWAPSAYLAPHAETPKPSPAPPPPPPTAFAHSTATSTNGVIPNGTSRPLPTVRAKPAPPAPPTKRPAGKKPAPPPGPRDSAVSMGSTIADNAMSTGGSNGRATPDGGKPSLAGGLAEALRQRQASMQGKKNGDDDDW